MDLRADKSTVYVIMNKDQYFEKMDGIRNDESKFQQLAADPTETLKSHISELNKTANSLQEEVKFSKVEGDFSPGIAMGLLRSISRGFH